MSWTVAFLSLFISSCFTFEYFVFVVYFIFYCCIILLTFFVLFWLVEWYLGEIRKLYTVHVVINMWYKSFFVHLLFFGLFVQMFYLYCPELCLFVCTRTVLILLSQGQCEHTHLNTHPHNVMFNRWYICQQIKPCWKINQFTSSPRLIDFSIMAILQLSLPWALGLRFHPFSTNLSITILVK